MNLEKMLHNFKKEAFRLESKKIYKIKGEWELFQKYKRGENIN